MKFHSLLLLISWLMQPDSGAELRVSISNIRQAQGSIYVAVYNNEADFLSTDSERIQYRKIVSVGSTGSLDISFPNLPPGNYAISCFHDVNGNGKLDTNLLGIPSEPYCFSNNARPKFRAPYWSEAKFYLAANGASQSIRLEKW
jgi:uncharacterized protein (DUF2141 family)